MFREIIINTVTWYLQLRALLTDALDAGDLLDDDDDDEEEDLNIKAVSRDYSDGGDDRRFVYLFYHLFQLTSYQCHVTNIDIT